MTVTVFPVDAVDTDADGIPDTPTWTGRMLRQVFGVLSGYAPAGRPLGAISGVRAGTPPTTVAATSSTVFTVHPHAGLLDLETAPAAGPYLYANDADFTGPINAASTANQRVDSVCAQLVDPAEGDGGVLPGVTFVCLPGAVGAAGGARGAAGGPPLIPSDCYELAQITVPKAGTGSPSATWVATPWGDTGWLSTTGLGLLNNAAGWTVTAQYRIANNAMNLDVLATRTGSTLTMASNGALGDTGVCTLTGSLAPTADIYMSYVASHSSGGGLFKKSSSTLLITDGHPTSTIAAGDVVKISLTYPLN